MPALLLPGKSSASRLLRAMTSSMPCVAARKMSLLRSACQRARSATRSISSEMSRFSCSYLIALRGRLARLYLRSSVSVLIGAPGPSDAS